jgi:hypothetical protein
MLPKARLREKGGISDVDFGYKYSATTNKLDQQTKLIDQFPPLRFVMKLRSCN